MALQEATVGSTPFCGCKEIEVKTRQFKKRNISGIRFKVSLCCTDCRAEISRVAIPDDKDWTVERVIKYLTELWNKRAIVDFKSSS
jgi:hypothetical protein